MYTSSKLMPNNATDYVSNDIFCNSFNLRPEKITDIHKNV